MPRGALSPRKAVCAAGGSVLSLTLLYGALLLPRLAHQPVPTVASLGVAHADLTNSSAPQEHRRLQGRSEDEWLRELSNISIVYTWVNLSDPLDRQLRARLGRPPNPKMVDCSEHQQLRFSMRAMEEFMPWHNGTVYLVTPGYWPHWLNHEHPRLRLIDQRTLLDDKRTLMNSNAYEQRFHRIPGITRFFIHMNDDYMLGKPLNPWDLFVPGGVQLFMGPSEINWDQFSLRNNTRAHWRGATAKSWALVDKTFITSRDQRIPHYKLKHSPFAYDTEAFAEMHRRWGPELQVSTRNAFRRFDDVITPILHHSVVLYGRNPRVWGKLAPPNVLEDEHEYVPLNLHLTYFRHRLESVADRRPQVFTVNGACSDPQVAAYYLFWLEMFYPKKCAFEW